MKTDNRKIDIYTKGRGQLSNGFHYECSTTWAKTCKEAKRVFCAKYNLDESQVKTCFSK